MNQNISYAASAAEDVNATFLAILTNLSHADGRLIYYTEDDPAGNLTPNIINVPMKQLLRRGAWHGDKYMIKKPNGVCFLDDDRDAGYTITHTSGQIAANPAIKIIDAQINRVTVYGAIDPERGVRFSGVSEDATAQADGTEINEYSKHYPDLRSDDDCANRATAIRTGTGLEPTRIIVPLSNVYAYNGERINLAYSPKSFSATDVYIEKVVYNMIRGSGLLTLNTGIFEQRGINEPTHRFSDENVDNITESIYNTDINTVYPDIIPIPPTAYGFGAGGHIGYVIDADNKGIMSSFYLGDKVDVSRNVVITILWGRDDANNDAFDYYFGLSRIKQDGSAVGVGFEGAFTSMNACAQGRGEKYTYTIASGDRFIDSTYIITFYRNSVGGGDARDITLTNVAVRYYVNRTVS